MGNDTTQQTQRTFDRDNLLRTCYGETGVTDFGLDCATEIFHVLKIVVASLYRFRHKFKCVFVILSQQISSFVTYFLV